MRYGPLAVSCLHVVSAVSGFDAAKYLGGKYAGEKYSSRLSLLLTTSFAYFITSGDIDENALFPLDGSIGSSKFSALNQLMMMI